MRRDKSTRARTSGPLADLTGHAGDVYTPPAAEARRRGLTIKFSRRMADAYPRAIELVASGRVDVASVVTHRIDLAATQTCSGR